MTISEIAFFILAALGVVSAIILVFARNPMHSIIALIICFFSISGHYVLMNAQFLAVVNIIVYAGAIMVLFLFVVMMMNLNELEEIKQKMAWKIAATIASGSLLLVLIASLKSTESLMLAESSQDIGLIETLGQVMLGEYLVPFIMTSILLNSAMIGAFLMAKKEKSSEIKTPVI